MIKVERLLKKIDKPQKFDFIGISKIGYPVKAWIKFSIFFKNSNSKSYSFQDDEIP